MYHLIHKKLNTLKTGAVRVSVDSNNSYEEIDQVISVIARSVEQLREYSSTYGMKTRKRKGDK